MVTILVSFAGTQKDINHCELIAVPLKAGEAVRSVELVETTSLDVHLYTHTFSQGTTCAAVNSICHRSLYPSHCLIYTVLMGIIIL